MAKNLAAKFPPDLELQFKAILFGVAGSQVMGLARPTYTSFQALITRYYPPQTRVPGGLAY